MATLKAELFKGDAKLLAALNSDPGHITPGAVGEHVRKIQTALATLLTNPAVAIAAAELRDGRYGPNTAQAVLRYKTERRIVNSAYQSKPDSIVGKMTMQALDDEMHEATRPGNSEQNRQIAAAIVALLESMDGLLGAYAPYLDPVIRLKLELVRLEAFLAAGGKRGFGGKVRIEYERARLELHASAPRQRPPIVFAAAPAVAAGGAAIVALEIAIALAAAVLLLCIVSEDFRDGLSGLVARTLEAMAGAVLESFSEARDLQDDVNRCNQKNPNPTPNCQKRRDEFKKQKSDFDTKQREASRAVADAAQRFGKLVPISKIKEFADALREARRACKALEAALEALKTLRDLLWKDCGCRFLTGHS